MTKYELSNGYVLTNDEIERRAKEWENGTWDGNFVAIRTGRPRLSDEPNERQQIARKPPARGRESA